MKLQQLLSLIRQAVDDFEMIQNGETIAVGLSGGKDSMALLYGLNALRRFYPQKFDLVGVTVDLGFQNFNLKAMKEFCRELEVPYKIVETQIAEIVFEKRKEANPCSLCAKMRKGALNQMLLQEGISKIAYAHHKDDFIETMLLSLLFEGDFHSFAPKTLLARTNITVIRPLLYVREAEVKGFCNKYQISVTKNPCPMDGNTRREYVKQVIQQLNIAHPGVKESMYAAILKEYPKKTPIQRD